MPPRQCNRRATLAKSPSRFLTTPQFVREDPKVPITFSLATRPVIVATASPGSQPRGAKSGAKVVEKGQNALVFCDPLQGKACSWR